MAWLGYPIATVAFNLPPSLKLRHFRSFVDTVCLIDSPSCSSQTRLLLNGVQPQMKCAPLRCTTSLDSVYLIKQILKQLYKAKRKRHLLHDTGLPHAFDAAILSCLRASISISNLHEMWFPLPQRAGQRPSSSEDSTGVHTEVGT